MSVPIRMLPIVRRMSTSDVPVLVRIHTTSWAPYELSVKLGHDYLTLFYSTVATSPDAFGYIAELEGAIAGYAVGFSDYNAYNDAFAHANRFSLVSILIRRILSGRILVSDLINLFSEKRKGKHAQFMQWHLGSLALDDPFKGTPDGREAIKRAMTAVVSELQRRGAPGCSAVCDARNVPMRKHFLGIGFVERELIPMAGRSVVLFERAFLPEAR